MSEQPLKSAWVRVPCSTSNMGVGFDTLGLALDRYLEVSFEPADGPLSLERTGTLETIEDDAEDLVAATFARVVRGAGAEPRGSILAHSDIPVARGLGSSAAATLAGYELARAALDLPPDHDGAFERARDRDGHGDNAAPCLWGGLRAVVPGVDGRPRVVELPLSEGVGFAYAAPAQGLATEKARAALPRLVTHRVATAQLGRLAALLQGLATADPDLIRVGSDDELHVPFRITLIPNAHNAIVAAGEAGAWAATISGAGTGLLAYCDPRDAEKVARAMHRVLAAGGPGDECPAFALRPDREGLVRL